MKKTKYRSAVAAAVHEGVSGMDRLGVVDQKTMQDFDVRCLAEAADLSVKDAPKDRQ